MLMVKVIILYGNKQLVLRVQYFLNGHNKKAAGKAGFHDTHLEKEVIEGIQGGLCPEKQDSTGKGKKIYS